MGPNYRNCLSDLGGIFSRARRIDAWNRVQMDVA